MKLCEEFVAENYTSSKFLRRSELLHCTLKSDPEVEKH